MQRILMDNYQDPYQTAYQPFAGESVPAAAHIKPMNRGFVQPLPDNPVVAMAYVPYTNMETTYSPEEALQKGTMFPELYKPFLGERGFSV